MEDIERISKRRIVPLHDWREHATDEIPTAAVEEPIFSQRNSVYGSIRSTLLNLLSASIRRKTEQDFLLADQVGLGKTIQLAMSAKLMALYGDAPILIIVPKHWFSSGRMK